ncbi:MAG: ABC transporter ATP-binding protein [Kiritimatiellia bacterium]
MAVPVHINGVTKCFLSKTVLNRIELKIEAGELFFLLGPSGCGKTTLLRAVAGLNEPDEGHIFAGDRDVTHLPPHVRDMGMVFQSYALWPHMTLRENVAFGLEMRGIKKSDADPRVMRALEMVKLADRAGSRPNELSGGQQQRVALARALVIEPQCILLDEPLSNLDAKLRLEMRTEIRRICKEAGLTAIYVTHDQKEALSIADRLAILDQGNLLQVGAPQEVYSRPKTRFIAQFIGETTFIEGRVRVLHEGLVEVETAGGDWSAAATEKFEAGQQVWLSVRPEAVRLHTDRTAGPNVFAAQMHGSIYLGEFAQHLVELKGGITLKALEVRPRLVARDNTRAETRLFVDPQDIQVLKE